MAVRIAFVCDVCPQDAEDRVQPVVFDSLGETWGDMVEALRSAGWVLTLEGAKVTHCMCPKHHC